MDKMKQETADITQENIERIGKLFPNVITEMKDENGKLKKGINFELLKQLLSGDVIDGEECYDFTWVGKKASIVEANTPIRKTLRPCIEESKNWETTENLYIEGDNLDVLKLRQESYLNSIKMIYIDPPYNTGKDFIYKDKFVMDKDEYEEQIGMYDEVGNRLFQNTGTNGRFHSDWCSMMYPRLKLARSLLAEDGVIFISIDDNEAANMTKIADEIFGEINHIASITWQKKYTRSNDSRFFSSVHDYLLCYAKDIAHTTIHLLPRNEEQLKAYRNPDGHPKGSWKATPLHAKSGTNVGEYIFGNGVHWKPPMGTYRRYNDETMRRLDDNSEIWFGGDGKGTPQRKSFLSETKDGVSSTTVWSYKDAGHNHEANNEMKSLGLTGVFSNPKPSRLLKHMSKLITRENDVILDFFSGSATTAHAVMQLNAEDGGSRKFIMVQLSEPCDEKSEAFKAGYKNICEIGKERIRRAGDKINKEIEESNRQLKLGEEPKKHVDTGFRVLKVDSTNMKDVFYAPSEYTQKTLTDQISNIKDDRTDLDLLYGVLLEWGLSLSLKHELEDIDGVKIHIVDNDSLIACFAENISEAVVMAIAKRQPLRAVFRDSSFASSSDKINVEEIFKLLAPNTSVKVI